MRFCDRQARKAGVRRARDPEPVTGPAASRRKILVIDDDPQMRELYSEILTRAGHEVVIAENGTQGLAQTERHPELIVVDLMMPNLSGYDFVKQLRSIEGHAHTPVIAASGLADGEWAVVPVGGNRSWFQKLQRLRRALSVCEVGTPGYPGGAGT